MTVTSATTVRAPGSTGFDTKKRTAAVVAATALVGAAAMRRGTAAWARPISTGDELVAKLNHMPAMQDVVSAARMPQALDPVAVRRTVSTLRHGVQLGDALELGERGARAVPVKVTLARGGVRPSQVDAVIKRSTEESLQEHFAFGVARALGIEHLVAPATVRAGGHTVSQLVDGTQARKVGVRSAADVQRVLVAQHRSRDPRLTRHEATALARVDRQLVQFFDYLTANADRHRRNVMIDMPNSGVRMIDQGLVAHGERAVDPLRPRLHSAYQSGTFGPARVELDDATLEIIRRRLPPSVLEDLLADAHSVARRMPQPMHAKAEKLLSPAFRDGMLARREHVLAKGGYGYRRDSFREALSSTTAKVRDAQHTQARPHVAAVGRA